MTDVLQTTFVYGFLGSGGYVHRFKFDMIIRNNQRDHS